MADSSDSIDLQCLAAQEPFVRALAQRLVTDDLDDVVQQTFLQALTRGATDVRRPRAWLGRIVRNVASNLRRARELREAHERNQPPSDLIPSAAELMEREERRRTIVSAVDALPDPLRAVVWLRFFAELRPRAVAEELALPVSIVWERQRRGLELLRERLGRKNGRDLRAWLVPVLNCPGPRLPQALPVAPVFSFGVIAMTTKAKIVATTAVLLMMAGSLAFWLYTSAPPDAAVGPALATHTSAAELAPTETPVAPSDVAAATTPDPVRVTIR